MYLALLNERVTTVPQGRFRLLDILEENLPPPGSDGEAPVALDLDEALRDQPRRREWLSGALCAASPCSPATLDELSELLEQRAYFQSTDEWDEAMEHVAKESKVGMVRGAAAMAACQARLGDAWMVRRAIDGVVETDFVTSLRFVNGGVADRELVPFIASHCPHLTSLNVSRTHGAITDASVCAVATHCPHLTLLDVSDTNGAITDASISDIAAKCPHLRRLDVSETYGAITDASVRDIAAHCPKLTSLYVRDTNGAITDASISDIAAHCPHLTLLDVSDTNGAITDASISVIAAHCPLLALLDVSETYGAITDKSIREIAARCPQLMSLLALLTADLISRPQDLTGNPQRRWFTE